METCPRQASNGHSITDAQAKAPSKVNSNGAEMSLTAEELVRPAATDVVGHTEAKQQEQEEDRRDDRDLRDLR